MTQKHQVKYRLDYQQPDFTITDVKLDFALAADITTVTAISEVTCLNEHADTLVLAGESLQLLSLAINDQPWQAYSEADGALIIKNVPKQFTLTIVNEIKPIENTALEGLYVSGG